VMNACAASNFVFAFVIFSFFFLKNFLTTDEHG
jgi:hypothetical protein